MKKKKTNLVAITGNLLYPVGPVGCAPHVSNARKSSTCNDGGLEVFGGRERNASTWTLDVAFPIPIPTPKPN